MIHLLSSQFRGNRDNTSNGCRSHREGEGYGTHVTFPDNSHNTGNDGIQLFSSSLPWNDGITKERGLNNRHHCSASLRFIFCDAT